ncbi:MAG: LamG domain-containing protein [Planctomycetota bacterium]|jgi:hypothetical protein
MKGTEKLLVLLLTLTLVGPVLSEDLDVPNFAGGEQTMAVFWEFNEDTDQPTNYYYIPEVSSPSFGFHYYNGAWQWQEGGSMLLDDEEALVQSIPEGEGDNLTVYFQVTWQGTETEPSLSLAPELWSDNIYFGGYEFLPPIDEYSLGDGWTQSIFQWTFEYFPGATTHVHILFHLDVLGTFIIDEVVVDMVVHDGSPPSQPGIRPTFVSLLSLEIVGPNDVAENSEAQYQAIARYDNDSTDDVTALADWSVEPNTSASINESGLLTTSDVESSENVVISAEYTEGEVNVAAEKSVTIFAICPSGSALEFDGEDDYVIVNDNLILSPKKITLSAWIHPEDVSHNFQIIGKWVFEDNEYIFDNKNNNDTLRFGADIGIGGSFVEIYSDDGVLTTNVWQHVAVTYDGSNCIFYVNGNNVGENNSYSGDLTDSDNPVYIGLSEVSGIGPRAFSGMIDDVRIYDRALTEQEINNTMHTRLSGDEPGLVGYWDFDEGEGQVAYDMSINANNGQLGSTAGDDDNDPEWIESDAPVGLCSNIALDIKPTSCPNPLNLNSKGILPVAVLGSQDVNVFDIDIASVRLAGAYPIRSSLEDVATPVLDPNDCNCTIEGPDGYLDLALKFRTQEIVEALLDEYDDLEKDQMLSVKLRGELYDGSVIIGEDCIVLVGNVPKYLLARVSDINEDGIVNTLDFALLAEYWLESTEP